MTRSNTLTTVATYLLLVLACAVSFLLPRTLLLSTVSAQAGPDEYTLTGLLRDFSSTHVDFNVVPDHGYGHYAGSIAPTLPTITRRPVFVGGGSVVAAQWLDALGRPIAPHLFDRISPAGSCLTVPGIMTSGLIDLNNQGAVDSFDSRLGPYGGGNVGSDALIATNSTDPAMILSQNSSEVHGSVLGGPGGVMTDIFTAQPSCVLTGTTGTLDFADPIEPVAAPFGMGPSEGDLVLTPGTTIVDADRHVGRLDLPTDAVLHVTGDVTMLCEGDLVADRAQVLVDGTLNLYVKGNIDITTSPFNMESGDPGRLRLVKIGPGTITALGNDSLIAGRIIAPEANLTVRQGSQIFGTFLGESLTLDNSAYFHVDVAYSGPVSFSPDTAGAAGPVSSGAITSAGSFNQWFDDIVPLNRSKLHTITMTRDDDGIYEHLDSTFYPVDDMLLGNEGQPHNNYYTYILAADFTYEACAGQFVEFQGGDGVWIFINNQLVMDLGGVNAPDPQYVDLDRLGLQDGRACSLRLFYADRSSASAVFRLRTNIELISRKVSTVTAMYD
ncbi:MAG: fibro-slime domain-containing protein [Planctomycetota bacterium]|jgi:fibro-slime domain-containing protein